MFLGSGANFGIPALFVAYLTVGLGGLCVLAVWVIVLLNPDETSPIKLPYALYVLALSVLVQIAGLVVLGRIPYDLKHRPIFGTEMWQFVWSFFLLASFALCVSSWWIARKASGPASPLLRTGSNLLLAIWVLGFIWYAMGS